jgi:hypothetical protein
VVRAALVVILLLALAPTARAQPELEPEPLPLVATDPFGTGDPVLSRGFSNEAAILGLASAALVLGLGITAVAAASPGRDLGLALGVATLGTLGISGPLVALGGASARTHPFVPGSIELQIAGFIAWGLSLASGIALVALDLDENEPARYAFLAPTIVGAASLVILSFDALVSAIQVDLLNGRRY